MRSSTQELYSKDILLTKYLLILKQGSSDNMLRYQVYRGICIFAGHYQLSVGNISVRWGRLLQSSSDCKTNIGARQVIAKPNHGGSVYHVSFRAILGNLTYTVYYDDNNKNIFYLVPTKCQYCVMSWLVLFSL